MRFGSRGATVAGLIPSADLPAGLRPEAELLLAAATVGEVRGRSEDRIERLLREGLDWGEVRRMAHQNRMGALLYESLRRQEGIRQAPPAILTSLERDYRGTKIRNLRLLRESLDLVSSLRERGVEAVPYKGPILATTVYEDLGLRQFKDVDLLVRPEDLAATRSFLLERGYRALEDLDDVRVREFLEDDCEFHFEHPEEKVLLEIHWQILPRRHGFGFVLADYWKRLVPLRIAGADIKTFPDEDLLLVLSVHHGEKHRWRRLRWLGDVARLLAARPSLDWRLVLERAREVGRERTILQGAYLAAVLLDAPIPPEVRDQALADPKVASEAGLVRGRMFREGEGLPRYTEWHRYVEADAQLFRARGARPGSRASLLRYLGAVLRPDWSDRQALALPAGLSFLYYLYRPARLIRRHRAALLKRL